MKLIARDLVDAKQHDGLHCVLGDQQREPPETSETARLSGRTHSGPVQTDTQTATARRPAPTMLIHYSYREEDNNHLFAVQPDGPRMRVKNNWGNRLGSVRRPGRAFRQGDLRTHMSATKAETTDIRTSFHVLSAKSSDPFTVVTTFRPHSKHRKYLLEVVFLSVGIAAGRLHTKSHLTRTLKKKKKKMGSNFFLPWMLEIQELQRSGLFQLSQQEVIQQEPHRSNRRVPFGFGSLTGSLVVAQARVCQCCSTLPACIGGVRFDTRPKSGIATSLSRVRIPLSPP